MDNVSESVSRALNVVFRQRNHRHIVDWADQYFELPADSSNNQDDRRWRTYGYQKFILHAFADLNTEETAVIKSVQMGLSKCALVGIGYESAHRMRTNGIWLPARRDRDEFANVQIKSMLRHCAEVGDQLRVPVDKKDPENTAERRGFKGAVSYCRATQRLQDVSSIQVTSAWADELSKMPRMIRDNADDVGKAPVDGIKGRLASADVPKLNLLSTPTELGVCQITAQFFACREKFHRHYQCPGCNSWQVFDWGDEKTTHGFKWIKQYDDNGNVDLLLTAKTCYYQCAHCDHQFHYRDLKTLDDEHAEWRSMDYDDEHQTWSPGRLRFDEHTYTYHDIETGEEVESPFSVGIQVRGWMSRRKKWWQICYQFLQAVEDQRQGKPAKMADWIQDCKGECYAPPQSSDYVRHGYLMHKQEQEPEWKGDIPDAVQAITAWWDCQSDRIEGLVVGWGYGEESWLIEHLVKWGDADTTDVLKSVQDLTAKTYRKASGFEMPILLSGVDARYKADAVNSIASGEWKTKIIPTYGNNLVAGPVLAGQTKTKKKRDNYGVTVCTNAAKEIVYSRYKIEKPGAGYIHIPRKDCFNEAFIKQMCIERKGIKRNDPLRWVAPENQSNEATDMMAGNLAIVMLAQQKFRLRFLPDHEYQDHNPKASRTMNLEQIAGAW